MDSLTKHALKLPEGLPSAWRLDCEVFADAIAPDPDLTVDQWADEHRVLSPESTSEHGPWRTARVPHAREIMQSLSPSDACTEVTFVAGTQVAKTEIGNNFIGAIVDLFGGPSMMVYPTSGTGRRSSKTRLGKMIEATPCLREKISDAARDAANSAMLKQFPGGVLAIAGANSAAELKSMPVRWLFEDEVDEYPDDVDGQGPADALAEKRTDTFRLKKKIYRTSTPTKQGKSKIWAHYLASDRRQRWVPCPHCAAEQVLRWEGFRWETRKAWEVTRADDGVVVEVEPGTEGARERDTGELVDVWYECEHCEGRIEERHKEQMLPAGRWVPQRPEVRHHKGYHLPAYYSPLGWFSWWEVVESRLKAERDPTKALLRLWHNTVAAQPYADQGEGSPDHADLKTRCAGEREPYRPGHVPMGAWMLTASVDVQGNRLEVSVKGWGREKESWLIAYEVIHGDTETSAPWDALDEYLQRRFPHACGAQLGIRATAVDAGYRTQTVYDWCRPRAHRWIVPVRGQSQAGKRVLGQPTEQDIDHRGKKIARGVRLWPIGADTAKDEIYARLKIEQPGPGYMHYPLGLPDEYYQGLVAERKVTRFVRGYLRTAWEKDEGARNEPLDLEVYAYAAALLAGLNRIDWDRLEAATRATADDLFVRAQEAAADAASAQRVTAQANAEADAEPRDPGSRGEPRVPRKAWLPRRNDWLRR